MRCDLHTHSTYSGEADVAFVGRHARECYSEPEEVYDTALSRGMDLVTITDHDTVDGVARLAHRPEVFWSEEVSVTLPSGSLVHVSVFDITQGDHEEIAARRNDGEALFAYLAEERIPAALNHMFSPMTGPRSVGDLSYALSRVGLVEALNGNMPDGVNSSAGDAALWSGRSVVGGSDAHTLATVARAHTEVPGARNREEFLRGLRAGATIPRGRSGSYAQLVGDIARVATAGYRKVLGGALNGSSAAAVASMLLVLPLTGLIPLFAFVARAHASMACHRDARRLENWPGFVPTPRTNAFARALSLEEAAR